MVDADKKVAHEFAFTLKMTINAIFLFLMAGGISLQNQMNLIS
jgi:hypothetical protein